ncbi:hypothetical protein CEX98_21970 [Pseudoalteromonas piscicida]|uniref:Uncharacterized protein n=1 Tax=Pseudoalteromonas piscicida TaxID=43662 RepID=A0A2A5JJH5_PSEO7|nr:hypothetical protein CEX98_21970 [Pseudoalteromonas piscicida]
MPAELGVMCLWKWSILLTDELKSTFWSNLKTTLKFIGIVVLGLSIAIMLDAYRDENYDELYFPLYFLAFFPVILVGVLTYTKLKNSDINKYLCSILFGVVITASTFTLYLVGHYLDSTELDLRFIKVMSLIAFVTMSLIYLQLPWKDDT